MGGAAVHVEAGGLGGAMCVFPNHLMLLYAIESCSYKRYGMLAQESDNEGIRTLAGRAQWISSPSP